ncbi:MAG: hypothetical protein LBQ19_05240 [Synergistaceae bacterium]|jgi:hypothetical protein|nr:hypothetical protein [Synergistaceae bacterium]
MPVHKEEKIWVVIVKKEDGHVFTAAYDNESDANNYYIEMQARFNDGGENIYIYQTILNRRDENIESDDAPWGALRIDIKSEFVEGLMEDMVPFDEIKPGSAEQFVRDRVDMVRRRTLKKIEEIVRDETKEELLVHDDDWHDFQEYRDMED